MDPIAVALLVLGIILALVAANSETVAGWLRGNLNWAVGVGLLLVLTGIGLVVNNNAQEPTQALTGWTDWFTSVVALVVAVFGIVDAVPKIATAVEKRAEARETEAEARLLEAEVRLLEVWDGVD